MSSGVAKLVAGRYRLVRSLGRGGMGEVWRARDELLHRDVAIKEVRQPVGDRRALREARAAAQLEHPDIVTVHDVVIHDGRPWIVMELIEGRSLAQVVERDGALPEREAARIGLRVLGALDLAHQRGILHRDVKPANILLDGDRAVLTDFGIAVADDGDALTATNQMVGSPSYIAPERVSGAEAGPAADLWALGVTLYTAVAGRSPFRGEDRQATFTAVNISDADPPPGADRLWPVIAGLLHKDPTRRLTADRAADLLAPLVAAPAPSTATTVTLPRPGPVSPARARTRTLPRRSSRRIVVPVLAVLLVAAAGWVVWRQLGTAADPGGQAAGSGAASTSSSSTPPMTTSSASSTPRPPPAAPAGFRTVTDDRGFSVAVPESWVESTLGWANYAGSEPGSRLEVKVTLAESGPEKAALPYLSGVEQITAAGTQGYKLIKLTGLPAPGSGGTAAEWEYTITRPENPRWGHNRDQVRAIVTGTGQVYQVTFSVDADHPRTLVNDWDMAQPVLTTIMRSFVVSV